MNTIVIESPTNEKTEWGLSFTNSNPEAKDYFPMPDKETAYRLHKYLNGGTTITVVSRVISNAMELIKANGGEIPADFEEKLTLRFEPFQA